MTVEGTKPDIDLKVDKHTFKGFDEKIQEQGKDFVKKMKDAEKEENKGEIKQKANAFINNSGGVLNLMSQNLKTNFTTIDTKGLQTYIEAKKAFDEDIKTLSINKPDITAILSDIQNFIDLKQIENNPTYADNFDKSRLMSLIPLATLGTTKTTLTDKLASLEKKETDVLDRLLDKQPSSTVAKELFEKNIIARNVLIEKNWKNSDTNKTPQQKNFEKLLEIYGKQEIETYEIKNYKIDQDKNIKYETREKKYDYIQVKFKESPAVVAAAKTPTTKAVEAKPATPKKTEDIMLGASTDVLHRARADAYKETAKRVETSDVKTNLTTLDGLGSYAVFENIFKEKGTETPNFLNKLLGDNLLEEISTYEAKSDKEAKTNRYYGVILDYIVSTKNEGLLGSYLSHVVDDKNVLNTKYLGTDQKTQIENFNKIVDKTKWTIDKTSGNGKKLEIIRLELASGITKNMKESVKGSIDDFFKAYGDIIVGILERFGGKGAARKFFIGTLGMSEEKFSEYFKELDKIYKEKYGLSDPQKTILNDELYAKYNPTEEKDNLPIGGGEVIPYSKETVISVAKTAFTGDNFQYLDPDLVGKAGTEKKIENTIIKEEKDGKIIKKINKDITPANKDKIIQQILNGDETTTTGSEKLWKDVAVSANIIMNTTKIYGDIEKPANKGQQARNNAQIQNRTDKGIKKGADIALFVGAYMMKGGENLAYTITETDGLNNKDSKAKESEPEVSKKLVFKDGDSLVKGGSVTEAGAQKPIHEIIEMKNAPQKLQIIRGAKTIEIKQETIVGGILTYVAVNDDKKAVETKIGDKIQEVPVEKSIADKRTEIKTELDNTKTIPAKTKFEGATYTGDNTNIYEAEIKKTADLFTGEKTYEDLILDKETLPTIIKENMSDIKNMFTFWNLQITKKNKSYTDVLGSMISTEQLKNIDTIKQSFVVKEAKDQTIIIEVKKNSSDAENTAKEGIITITKDASKKLTTTRK